MSEQTHTENFPRIDNTGSSLNKYRIRMENIIFRIGYVSSYIFVSNGNRLRGEEETGF